MTEEQRREHERLKQEARQLQTEHRRVAAIMPRTEVENEMLREFSGKFSHTLEQMTELDNVHRVLVGDIISNWNE